MAILQTLSIQVFLSNGRYTETGFWDKAKITENFSRMLNICAENENLSITTIKFIVRRRSGNIYKTQS